MTTAPIWGFKIFDAQDQHPMTIADLLNQLQRDGNEIRYVLTNGINRWTVFYTYSVKL